MSEKLSRKEIRQNVRHDKFVSEMESAYGYFNRNVRNLTIVVIVAAVIIAGAWGFYAWRQNQETKAQTLLADAIAIMEAPVEGSPSAAAATPDQPKYKSEAEKIGKAEPMLKQVTTEFGSTDAADVADLYLGRIAASRGDNAAAQKSFEKFVKDHPKSILAGTAEMSLYEVRIGQGQYNAVISDLNKEIASDSNRLPKDVLLSLLARTYEISGDSQKAHDTYQRVANEYPDSAYAIDAQRKLARG